LQTYGWGKFDFTFIWVAILIVWGFFQKGKFYVNMPKLLAVYLWYYLFAQVISATSLSSLIPIGWLRLFLTYGLFFSVIKLDLLKKYYSKVGLVCLSFFAVQIVAYYAKGIKIPGVFEFLPLSLDTDSASYFASLTIDKARSCSFFSEPAHFAQFLFPLLIIKLFKNKQRNDWLFIFSIVLSLLLLKSGNGLFGLLAIAICYGLWNLSNSSLLKRVVFIVIFPIIAVSGATYYLQSEAGQEVISRKDQLKNDTNSKSGLSGFIRIFRGYYVFDELPTFRKVFGANNSDLIRTAIAQSKVSSLFMENDLYFNVVQNTLIRTGIVGIILLFLFYFGLFIRGNAISRTLIITLSVLSFISALYFTETMLLYLIIAYNNTKDVGLCVKKFH